MNYEETIELENNIRVKNEAETIYSSFRKNVKLNMKDYKSDGVFLVWSDSHNKEYINVIKNDPVFICRYLHENYTVNVSPAGIFNAIKGNNRGVQHLKSYIDRQVN